MVNVREVVAHMIQLCEYITEANSLADIDILKAKANQVRKILMEDEDAIPLEREGGEGRGDTGSGPV